MDDLRRQIRRQLFAPPTWPLELDGLKNIVNSTTETHMPDYSAYRDNCGTATDIYLNPTLAIQAQAHRDEARKLEKRAKVAAKAAKKAARVQKRKDDDIDLAFATLRLIAEDRQQLGANRIAAARLLLVGRDVITTDENYDDN